MKQLFVVCCVVFFGLVAWRLGSRLSPDAIGMAVGLLLGVLAGIPAAVLVLASGRRERDARLARNRKARSGQFGSYNGSAPVIILAGPGYGGVSGHSYGVDDSTSRIRALPGPAPTVEVRDFRVVGDVDGQVEEW